MPTASDHRPAIRDRASRFKLHHVYYLLAAFDVVALALSVSILVWTTANYGGSVATTTQWAELMQKCWALMDAASKLNLPGNQAFEDVNDKARIDALSTEIDEFYEVFSGRCDGFRTAVTQMKFPDVDEDKKADFAAEFPAFQAAAKRMTDQAAAIFPMIRRDEVTEAAAVMASMDNTYRDLTETLRKWGDRLEDIQSRNLGRQYGIVRYVRWIEFGFAPVLLAMVTFVTLYGRKLAREMRAFQDELTSHRDRLESLVGERTAALETSLQKLRMSDRLASIGTLAAGLGHDMSNVLFPVRCRLDVLTAGGLDEPAAAEVRSISQSVAYLQQLSDGLRLLSLDPDDEESAHGTTDLQSWWDEVRPLFLTALPRGATLEGAIAWDLGRVAVAPHRLTQAVFNLVVNSGAAITEGGTVRVWARNGDGDGTMRLGVTDDGQGMTEDVRRQALDPFFTTKKRGLSTGLGLALVQGVAVAAGGRVEIDSAPGEGTTVTLILPLAAEAAAPKGAGRCARRAVVSLGDRRVATFIAAMLRAAGFEAEVSDAGAAPDGLIWVTAGGTASSEETRAFLAGGEHRHVIRVGGPTPEGGIARIHVIDGTWNIEAMRKAIADISERLAEVEP